MKNKSTMDELRRLFMELYDNEKAWDHLVGILERNRHERRASLKKLDEERRGEGAWFRSHQLLGMMLYTENFGGDLRGVRKRLPYLEELGVNYLHLMPLLDSPEGKSDGGYSVSDFHRVRPDLGTMEDLEDLAEECHGKGMVLCIDFVLNHVSDEHVWAREARKGDPTAMSRFFMYDNWEIPRQYEQTVPQVFPATAPGNFTWYGDVCKVVMTTFHPYQWDLNYANPMVFNDMTDQLLYLANRGMDVIRLDAIPYLWKALGTSCRNLPQVHTLIRMMHLACEIVCPGVALLGEVVMEPRQVMPYFGSAEDPECDILYNVTTMCTTWHTLATRDVRLLQHQMGQVAGLGKEGFFQNYLRCHDDIGWGLDFPFLGQFFMGEVSHKKFLNDWFTGNWYGSPARGEVYNDDAFLGDARLCGTTASLCGIESALAAGDEGTRDLEKAIRCDLMLHAWMLAQSGIPVIYSGDEVGQLNDYSYHEDPARSSDSRYLHRGAFDWEMAARRKEKGTPAWKIFRGIRRLARLRSRTPVFAAEARMSVEDLWESRVMGIRREHEGETFLGVFNFSDSDAGAHLPEGRWKNMLTGKPVRLTPDGWLPMKGYGFFWLIRMDRN